METTNNLFTLFINLPDWQKLAVFFISGFIIFLIVRFITKCCKCIKNTINDLKSKPPSIGFMIIVNTIYFSSIVTLFTYMARTTENKVTPLYYIPIYTILSVLGVILIVALLFSAENE